MSVRFIRSFEWSSVYKFMGELKSHFHSSDFTQVSQHTLKYMHVKAWLNDLA